MTAVSWLKVSPFRGERNYTGGCSGRRAPGRARGCSGGGRAGVRGAGRRVGLAGVRGPDSRVFGGPGSRVSGGPGSRVLTGWIALLLPSVQIDRRKERWRGGGRQRGGGGEGPAGAMHWTRRGAGL